MATSGSYDYAVTASDVLTEALENIGVLGNGETIDSNDQTSCLRTLNLMVKQWSGNFDFAPGLKMFSRRTGYIFLQKSQSVYSIGPSGDNATLSYVSTTMRVAGIATATTLEITSSTGMTAADYIGIELNSGSIYWTTISSVTDGDTIVIPASGLSGAVAAGNRIFAYTTKLIRPLYFESMLVRDTDGNDSHIGDMTRGEYEANGYKATTGTPSKYAYENSLTNGTLYIDVTPSDVTNVMRGVFMAPAEDYDLVTNNVAFPQEWFLPVAQGLSKLIAPKFGKEWTQLMQSNLDQSMAIARTSYAETVDIYFQPGID